LQVDDALAGNGIVLCRDVDCVCAALVKQAAASTAPGGGVSIMAGGGIIEANAETLVISTEVTEVHGSFRSRVPTGMQFIRPGMYFDPAPASEATDSGVADHRRWERLVTNADTVRAVVEQLERLDEDRRRRNME
jgi:copper homeostasis protein CutC